MLLNSRNVGSTMVILLYCGSCGLENEYADKTAATGAADAGVRTPSLLAVCDWVSEKYRDWFGSDEEEEDSATDDAEEPTHDGDDGDGLCRLTSDIECDVLGAMLLGGVPHEMLVGEIITVDPAFAASLAKATMSGNVETRSEVTDTRLRNRRLGLVSKEDVR